MDSSASAVAAGGARDDRGLPGGRWATHPRPHVDRLACAWLIRRFIDPAATIVYIATRMAARSAGQAHVETR